MVYSSQLIHAVAKPLPGQTSKGGTGTVERRIDPSTYVISLGRENVTVKVTEGSLSVGQQVAVAARNERFIITRMPTPEREPADDADSFTRENSSSRSRAPIEPPRNVRADIETIIGKLRAQPFRQEDAEKCETLFKTVAPRLSSLDKALTSAASDELRSLAASPRNAPAAAGAVQNAITLMEQLREKTPAPQATPSGRSATLQSPLPDGLYRFGSASEAIDFLKFAPASGETFTRELDAKIRADGSVVVRTDSYDGKHTVATIVTKEDAARELASLPGRFTSRAFQSIPPAVFEQLFDNRGSIDFDRLRALDGFAAELKLPAASTRAGSRAAQDAALLQWLTSAVDARTPSASLSSLLPVFSAQSIIDSLEEIAQSVARLSGEQPVLPAAEKFAITEGADLEKTDRSKLLETIMRRLGFTLENSLATTGKVDESSLKQGLLETAGALQAEKPLSPAEAEFRARGALLKMADDFFTAVRTQLSSLLSAAEGAPGGAGDLLRKDIEAALQKGADELSKLINRLAGEAKELVRAFPEKPADASRSAIGAFTGKAAEQIENLAQGIAHAVEDIVQKSATTTSEQEARIAGAQPGKPVASYRPAVTSFTDKAAQQIEALLREFTNDSETAIAKSANAVSRLLTLPRNEAEKPANGNGHAKISTASLAVLNTFTGDAAKRIEALLLEIERAGGADPKKNGSREVAKLLAKLADAIKDVAESAERNLPAKIIAASQAPNSAATEDAGKSLEAQVQKLTRESEGALKKAAMEIALKLDRLAVETRELAVRTAATQSPETSSAARAPAEEKAAIDLHKAIKAFADNAAKQIEEHLRRFSGDTEAAIKKSTAEIARLLLPRAGETAEPLPQNTGRELTPKISAASLAVLDAFTGDASKRLETLLLEIERANTPEGQKSSSGEVARLLDKLAGEAKALAESAARSLGAKIAAASLGIIDNLDASAGKRVDAQQVTRESEAALKRVAAEIAGALERLSDEAKALAGRTARTPAPQPDDASTTARSPADEKDVVDLRKAITTFANDSAKQIEAQLSRFADDAGAAIKKSAAEIARLLTLPAGETAEPLQQNTGSALTTKISAASLAVLDAFTGDASKRLETLLLEIERANTPEGQRSSSGEVARLLDKLAGEAKALAESAARSLGAKITAASLGIIDNLDASAGKRVDAQQVTRESEAALKRVAAEIAGALERLSDEAKALAGRTASPADEKSAIDLRKAIITFANDSAKQIEAQLSRFSDDAGAAIKKSAAEIARLLTPPPGETPQPLPQNTGRSLTLTISAASRSVLNNFMADASKRLETLLLEIERAGGSDPQKVSAREAAGLLDKLAVEAKTLAESAARSLGAKITAASLEAIDNQTGEAGKRVPAQAQEIFRDTEAAVKKASAEIAGFFDRLAGEAKKLATRFETAAPVRPSEKASDAVRQTVAAFAGEAGKRIETQLKAFLNDSEAEINKNSAEIAKLLSPHYGNEANPPLAGSARETLEKISAPSLAVLKTFTADAAKRLEIMFAGVARASQGDFSTGAGGIASLLENLADEIKYLAVKAAPALPAKITAASRPVIEAVMDNAEKGLNTRAQDILRDCEAALQKNAARLAEVLGTFAREADELAKTAITGPSLASSEAKLSEAARAGINAFAGDAGKTLKMDFVGLDLLAKTQARELPETMAALLQSSINAVTGDMEKQAETLERRFTSSLAKDAGDITRVLNQLAERLSKLAEASSEKQLMVLRPAIDAFITDAGKRIEILLTNVVRDIEGTIQQGAGGLNTLPDKLTGESKLFVQTLLASLAAASDATAGPRTDKAGSPGMVAAFMQKNTPEAATPPVPLAGHGATVQTQSAADAATGAKLAAALLSTFNTFTGEAEQRVQLLVREFLSNAQGALEKGTDDLSKLFRQLANEAKDLVLPRSPGTTGIQTSARPETALFQGETGNNSNPLTRGVSPDSQAAAQKAGDDSAKSAMELRGEINHLARAARELPERLSSALRSALDAFADDAGKQGETRLREFRHELEQILKQEVSQRTGQADETSGGRTASEARESRVSTALLSTLQSALEKDLPALHHKVDELKPHLGRTAETLFRELLHDPNNPAADRPGTQELSGAKDDQSLARQSVRQNIETLINRFESLQMLARQVSTPAGEQQQIIAVPIKVGSEWTEMHVRFVNKKKGKSGEASGHYTVFLNVAPSLLGAIGSTMEYTRNKNLSISMHFEHHATRQWFAANKTALTATLSALGLPNPQISLFMERKQPSSAGSVARMPSAGPSQSLLDVKA